MTPDKDVIAYCRIGERSSHSWFVLHELLGYERVRNYDGSWTRRSPLRIPWSRMAARRRTTLHAEGPRRRPGRSPK